MANSTKEIFTATYPVRPLIQSHQSNSLPSTPRQRALDFEARSRSPSPRKGLRAGSLSPRSVCSDSHRSLPSSRSVVPTCRFMSTQTSRRRIPYSIGADPLEDEAQPPKATLKQDEEKKLSADLQLLYEHLLPTEDSQARREQAVQKLNDILTSEWPDKQIKVSMFGSSGNLLFTTSSDVDVCVTMMGLETVCSLAEVLAKRGMKRVTCVHAKAVPIVKIWDPELQLACDLNVNNHVAIKNTHLVRAYMEIDHRVRALAMTVKYWTNRRLINEASGGTLSSYCWTLLVINYLQTRNPPILPVIGLMEADGTPKKRFDEEAKSFQGFGQKNTDTIGELLFQFFRYYGYEIDYETAVISVRTGKLLKKKEKNWHFTSNNRICVEEPFNTDRNLGNTADDTACRGIHMELRQAFSRVAQDEDIVLRVCEKYEFPPDEPRTPFERPQPQPRPVLSRSASQTGRGGRHAGTTKAPKQQHYNQRSGPNSRRASSAASYNPNLHPVYQNGQVILQQGPGSEYYMPVQPNRGIHEQLSQLSQQLSAEESRLRYQQMLVSQAQLQAAGLPPVQNRSMNPKTLQSQQQQRAQANGYSVPRPSNVDNPHMHTSIHGSFPSSPRYDQSTTPGLQSNSQQITDASNEPLRRGIQRTSGPINPGSSRSQSQPARPAQGQMVPLLFPSGQYAYGLANGQIVRPDQLTASYIQRHGYPTHIISPYVGIPVDATMAEPTRREYLGYGIGGNSQIGASYTLGSSYEDVAAAQARRKSPHGRLSSPEHYNDMGTPSSAETLDEQPNGSTSRMPLLDTTAGIPSERPAVSAGPLIVNGSTRPARSSSEAQRIQDAFEMQHPVGPRHPSAHSAPPERAERSFVTRSQLPESLRQQRSQDSSSYAPQVSGVPTTSMNPSTQADRREFGASSRKLPDIGSMPFESHAPNANPSLDPGPDGKPLPNVGGRPPVPPLDLTERTRMREQAASSGLSPVQEMRTPSPSITRKPDPYSELQTNGKSSPDVGKSTRDWSTPAPVNGKENANGIYPAASQQSGPTRLPTVQVQQANAWQPVRKGGKKNKGRDPSDASEAKTRGEPLPVQESERKGG